MSERRRVARGMQAMAGSAAAKRLGQRPDTAQTLQAHLGNRATAQWLQPKLAARARTAQSGRKLARQAEDAPATESKVAKPAPPTLAVTSARVLQWAEKLYGMPYAFSADDTMADIVTKERALTKEIQSLTAKLSAKQDLSKASPELKRELEQAAKDLQASKQKLAECAPALQTAKEQYWNKTLKALLTQHIGTVSAETLEAVHQYGIVCNTFVEITLRMSGLTDFPLTGQRYVPQSEKYRAVEEERMTASKITPGWSLDWSERLVDWAAAHGDVLYDSADPAKQELAFAAQAGDIVIFSRGGTGRYHVNLVVPDGAGKFNLAGASSPGRYSGKALASPFEKYDDKLAAKGGPRGIPSIMGQEKYLWILRPRYAVPEPAASPRATP